MGKIVKRKITHDDVDREFHLLRNEPEKFLELTNELVEQRPDDPQAYFSRHWAWENLGSNELALADLDKSLSLQNHYVTQRAKGRLLHGMRRYRDAVACLDQCEQMDPEHWLEAFGPLIRADCHARLGNEAAALADCNTLPDDHWTPGMFGLPAGNKPEVAAELSRRAAAARGRRRG